MTRRSVMFGDAKEQAPMALKNVLHKCIGNALQIGQDSHQNDSTPLFSPQDQCYELQPQARTRKRKRPFSPETIGNDRKTAARAKPKKKETSQNSKNFQICNLETVPFLCDKCGSSTVVDPSRCRLPSSQIKKAQTVRKKLDPVTNKILNLCNACGLAFSRPPKKCRELQPTATVEDRQRYIAEAEAFAKSVAQRIGKPAAERLYCPSFKSRPCSCIQTYLSPAGDGPGSELETRVETLLELFYTALDLNRRKDLFPEYAISDQKLKSNISAKPIERKQRQRDYEHFILETRQLLREKLHLCELACQRILLYSNNFLHKKLKSSPDQSSRLSRQLGRGATNSLKSIEDLASITCCSESCSRLALTHSTLLEEWRKQAALGQRQARRVLAEMLTPSGGTKANCYKFISMVTGCAPTTISSVSHQMRITKGNREPPEHGLKKWYRENSRKLDQALITQNSNCDQQQIQSNAGTSTDHFGQPDDSSKMEEQDPKTLLEQQRQELEEAKRQLFLKQQELDRCQQIIDQHLQQQVFVTDNTSSNPLWKVNRTELLTLPVDSNESIMSGLATGQSVQLIDLMPGTYIAVPSGFDSSAYISVGSDSKQSAPNSGALPTDNLHGQQEVLYSQCLPENKSNSSLIQSENGTIFTVSSTSDMVNSIIEDVEPIGNGYSEILVAAPAACDGVEFAYSTEDKQCNLTVARSDQPQSVISGHDSGILPSESNEEPHVPHVHNSTSCPTSVIMPPNHISLEEHVSSQPNAECSSMLKCVKNVSDFDLSSSLNSVILVPTSEPSQSQSICMNTFDHLFE